jgi:hypothetical protein
MSLIGLEYLLLFGLPENKIEGIYQGRTVTCLAFPSPEEAQAHFELWLQTLARWQGLPPRYRKRSKAVGVGRFDLSCKKCVVRLLVPLNWDLMFNCFELEADWEVWGRGPGRSSRMEWFRLLLNLEAALRRRFSNTELLLTRDSMVAPAAYAFLDYLHFPPGSPESQRGLVGQCYYQGTPDLLVETVLPWSEGELRGEKMALYRGAKLPRTMVLASGTTEH